MWQLWEQKRRQHLNPRHTVNHMKPSNTHTNGSVHGTAPNYPTQHRAAHPTVHTCTPWRRLLTTAPPTPQCTHAHLGAGCSPPRTPTCQEGPQHKHDVLAQPARHVHVQRQAARAHQRRRQPQEGDARGDGADRGAQQQAATCGRGEDGCDWVGGVGWECSERREGVADLGGSAARANHQPAVRPPAGCNEQKVPACALLRSSRRGEGVARRRRLRA